MNYKAPKCPYYINSDRLLDLFAIMKGGIDENIVFEERITHQRKNSRGATAEIIKPTAKVSASGNRAEEVTTEATTKGSFRQTEAMFLDEAIKELEPKDAGPMLFSRKEAEYRDHISIGDYITICGKISESKEGPEDYITFGSDKHRTNNQKEHKKKQNKKRRIAYTILTFSVLAAISLALFYLKNMNGLSHNNLYISTIGSFLVVIIGIIVALFVFTAPFSKDTAAIDYKAMKKDRKTVNKSINVKIKYIDDYGDYTNENTEQEENSDKSADCVWFIGELYDDYLYQSSLKDFLGRNVTCFGIVKHAEELKEDPTNIALPSFIFIELEIIAIYS